MRYRKSQQFGLAWSSQELWSQDIIWVFWLQAHCSFYKTSPCYLTAKTKSQTNIEKCHGTQGATSAQCASFILEQYVV